MAPKTSNGTKLESLGIARKPRTPMHTLKIVACPLPDEETMYAATLDGRVTAIVYDGPKYAIPQLEANYFNRYDGMSKWLRQHKAQLKLIAVSKSENIAMVEGMSTDTIVVETIRKYVQWKLANSDIR